MLPEKHQYVNMHAHRLASSHDEWVLTSLHGNTFTEGDLKSGGQFSIGLHPWEIEVSTVQSSIKIIEQAVKHENIIAIGEIGLDKLRNIPLSIQLEVFKAQLLIAEQASLPVIIHSVKSTQELILLKKELKLTVPLIVHGFSGSLQEAGEMLNKGFNLSIGAALLHSKKLQSVIGKLPQRSIFLETDEANVSIEDIYAKIAELWAIPIGEVKVDMQEKIRILFQ